eukprot:4072578-Amphidinium_carterae.1
MFVKPEILKGADANDHAKYVVWRIKLTNWVSSAFPGSMDVLERMEKRSNEEVTADLFRQLQVDKPWLMKLSTQLRAIMISLCSDEPLSIVVNSHKGDQGGLEALRRLNDRYDPLGPRAAKTLLSKILGGKPVHVSHLRLNIEELEKWCEGYHIRTGAPLAEDLLVLVLEQLLLDPWKTH